MITKHQIYRAILEDKTAISSALRCLKDRTHRPAVRAQKAIEYLETSAPTRNEILDELFRTRHAK